MTACPGLEIQIWPIDRLVLDAPNPRKNAAVEADFDLSLTGFDPGEIDNLPIAPEDDEKANAVPPLPENPVPRPGDLWLCWAHRVMCGDATSPEAVAQLRADRKPLLMVTDPPYGIQLDM
jgi:hypothetical protein